MFDQTYDLLSILRRRKINVGGGVRPGYRKGLKERYGLYGYRTVGNLFQAINSKSVQPANYMHFFSKL